MKQRFSQHMRYYERSLILILMLFSASVMQAQNRTVKGTVSDAQGEPIIGANVVIVGGTKGVITDLDGKYSIQVPENGAVLKFSYIGFKTCGFLRHLASWSNSFVYLGRISEIQRHSSRRIFSTDVV